MAVLTVGALTQLFEQGDTPNGQAFADLIASLRHKLETIPAADIQGLAALITTEVDARVPGGADPNLQITISGNNIVVRSGDGDPVRFPLATLVAPGLFSKEEKGKLSGIAVGATADQSTSDIITLISAAVGDDRLSANALKDLTQAIDDRIAAAGGGGGGGGLTSLVKRTVSGSSTYTALANYALKDFVLIPSAIGEMRIGTTSGGKELFDYDAPDTAPVVVDLSIFRTADTTIFLTGNFEARFIIQNYV